MHNPIEIIDQHATAVARSLDIVVYSLEGLYEKIARESPSAKGIQEYWLLADQVIQNAIVTTLNQMSVANEALYASLSLPERDHIESQSSHVYDEEIALASFGAIFAQAKIAYVTRLRALVAARVFGADTYSPDPKIMTRNGRRWDFSEYAFLTARGLLVNWYNESKIDYLTSIGAEEFTLFTEDPELIYSVFKVEDYPQLAGELFHPRTTKLVGGAYVSS